MSNKEMRKKVLELQRQGKLPSIAEYLWVWNEASAIFRPKILRHHREEAEKRLQQQRAAKRKYRNRTRVGRL